MISGFFFLRKKYSTPLGAGAEHAGTRLTINMSMTSCTYFPTVRYDFPTVRYNVPTVSDRREHQLVSYTVSLVAGAGYV